MFLFIGWTPLIAAAQFGHLNIIESLVTYGADVNNKSNRGKFLILYFIGYTQFVSNF